MTKSISKNKSALLIASFEGCPRVWKMASAIAKSGFKVDVLEWGRDSVTVAPPFISKVSQKKVKLNAPYGQGASFKLAIWWVYVSIYVLFHTYQVVQPQNLDNLFPISIICKIKKMKIVYDIADFYADAFIPQNLAALRGAVAWLERTLILTTDAVLIADGSRLEQIEPNGKTQPKIIYNSPPLENSKNNVDQHVKDGLVKNRRFTLLYAGILAPDRGLHSIIRAVKDLAEVELIIAGFGQMTQELIRISKRFDNIRFLGRVSYSKVLELTNSCDCVIALYDTRIIPNNVYASPNKLFESMMCGKPIIVNDGTAMANIVQAENCGLVVKYGDIDGLVAALNKLKTSQSIQNTLGLNGRRAYGRKFNWQLMERELLTIYRPIYNR